MHAFLLSPQKMSKHASRKAWNMHIREASDSEDVAVGKKDGSARVNSVKQLHEPTPDSDSRAKKVYQQEIRSRSLVQSCSEKDTTRRPLTSDCLFIHFSSIFRSTYSAHFRRQETAAMMAGDSDLSLGLRARD